MSDSQLDKLISRRTRLSEKHAEFDRRLSLMQCRGRIANCAEDIKRMKRWKLLCKDMIAIIDGRIDSLRKPTPTPDPAKEQSSDLALARAFDHTAPEERDVILHGKSSHSSAADKSCSKAA